MQLKKKATALRLFKKDSGPVAGEIRTLFKVRNKRFFHPPYEILLGLQRLSASADTLPHASHEYFMLLSLSLQT
jgi:hypothetical protein